MKEYRSTGVAMSDRDNLSRRDFLREAGSLTLVMALTPDRAAAPASAGPPVPCAVIGTGQHGREILSRLSRLGNAPVVAICDVDQINLNRGRQAAPGAATFTDYRPLLETQRDVQAVFVATPTHTHRPIVTAGLQAGKHVYCE
ncbi:MAG: Gfo/Idh/MocA family oxidoreductase, partial [Armatimonadetes bacterium]|nr:Gfo/Idh/MocA family oxidoreductase [Armatimonadota bacterium]